MMHNHTLTKIALLKITMLSVLLLSACSDEKQESRSPLKGLSDVVGRFEKPDKNHVITFPQAHAPHKNFQQEWWYLTANLRTENGQSLAAQWTLFRRAVEDKHWYFAHAALADENQHFSAFRSAREELGNLVIKTMPFYAQIDDWQWQSSQGLLPANLRYGNFIETDAHQTLAETSNPSLVSAEQAPYWQVNLDLNLDETPTGELPYFLQGENGFSQKHQSLTIASHYYSQPFIKVSGEVFWQNKWQKVTGDAWFDREWGSQMLAEDQQGWDWFSLRLNEDTALMVYRIRSTEQDYLYGSIMRRNGTMKTLSSDAIKLTRPKNMALSEGSDYPELFSIKIAEEEIDIEVSVINNKQIMRFGIEYFEGMVSFTGSHQGRGFLEMTGYVQ